MLKLIMTVLIFLALTAIIVFGIKAIKNPHEIAEYLRHFRERKPSFAAPSFHLPAGPSNR